MNRQDLENQLAQLEGGGPFDGEMATNRRSIWDPLPDDWKPEPRYVKEEPDYAAGFQVGDKFMHDPRPGSPFQGERQAIPKPLYDGPPGTIITREMEEAYRREWDLWNRASMELEAVIRRRIEIAKFPNDGYERRPTKEELETKFAESWGWLKGLWNSRGYTEPSMEQLDEWSQAGQESTSQSELDLG